MLCDKNQIRKKNIILISYVSRQRYYINAINFILLLFLQGYIKCIPTCSRVQIVSSLRFRFREIIKTYFFYNNEIILGNITNELWRKQPAVLFIIVQSSETNFNKKDCLLTNFILTLSRFERSCLKFNLHQLLCVYLHLKCYCDIKTDYIFFNPLKLAFIQFQNIVMHNDNERGFLWKFCFLPINFLIKFESNIFILFIFYIKEKVSFFFYNLHSTIDAEMPNRKTLCIWKRESIKKILWFMFTDKV